MGDFKIINLIIKNGVVEVVQKIPESVKNLKTGHFYKGFDYKTKTLYNVGNEDAGKSAQLVKLVMTKKNKVGLGFLIFLIITGLISFIIVLLFISSIFKQETKQENIKNNPILINSEIKKDPIIIQNEIKEFNDPIFPDNQNIIYLENQNQNPYLDTDLNYKKILFENEINQTKIDILEKNAIILKEENNIYSQTIKAQNEKIMKLEQNIHEKELKIKNLSSNEFFINLGAKLSKICETTKNEEVKRTCLHLLHDINF